MHLVNKSGIAEQTLQTIIQLINDKIEVGDFPDQFLLFSLVKPVQVCRISVVLPHDLW